MSPLAIRSVIGAAALVVAAGVFAQASQVYRYVDPSGRVVYSDRPPPADVKNVQTKRLGANLVETSEPSIAAQQAADRYPATLFTFDCGEVCQSAEAVLNRRGVPFSVVDVQKDEQGMIRMKAVSGDERAPVLTLGDTIVVKGYNEARWQAALDEAGYPKTPGAKRTAAKGTREPAAPTVSAPVENTRVVTPMQKGGDYPKN